MQTPFAIYDALTSIEVPPEKVRVVVQSMEHDMALFASRSQFDQLDQFSGSRHDLLRAEMASFREHTDERFEQVRGEIAALAKRTDERLDNLEHRLLAKLGTLMVAGIGVVATLVTIF